LPGQTHPPAPKGVHCVGATVGACKDVEATAAGFETEGVANAGALNPAMVTLNTTTPVITALTVRKPAETSRKMAGRIRP
jgi:hypothetical protein